MKFLPFVFFILTISAYAERLTTRVHSVDRDLILFENGRVGFLSGEDKSLASTLTRGEWLDVELDKHGNFLGASVVPAPKSFSETFDPEPTPAPQSYEPTNLSSTDEASAIFRRMNRNHQRESQCYNRAHIWAFEEWKNSGLRSMKLFMFFTRSYIRKYRYNWWFHVTPLTYVNGTPMTMDRTFMKGPVTIKSWTDKFIYSKRDCPIVSKYSDYRDHQEAEHCYLYPASMYYWQPRDLENNERNGYTKTKWIQSEVNWAYYEAF